MKKIFFIFVIFNFFLQSCNSVRDSAGVNRKVIDEYTVIEKPPLIIPPNFNLLPPEQIESKKIEDTDSELAKEILFGLDETKSEPNKNYSLINEIINETKANEVDDNIRDTINADFNQQKSTKDDETTFVSDEELNKAILESDVEIDNSSNAENKNKAKKKKRFFFF